MGGRGVYALLFLLFGLFICPGSSVTEKETIGHNNDLVHEEKEQTPISTTQMDVTNPITTVPTITTSPNPVINPNSNPESPASATPTVVAPATSPPTNSNGSWCVASQSASQIALQVALDYACGYGGADCSAIQTDGSCYNPSSIRDHASFAFNDYYQKNPVPTSCNFGGTAVITSTDPSLGTCRYPSTSTSSSVLNTTNQSGSTVFGSEPSSSSSSAVIKYSSPLHFLILACLVLWLFNLLESPHPTKLKRSTHLQPITYTYMTMKLTAAPASTRRIMVSPYAFFLDLTPRRIMVSPYAFFLDLLWELYPHVQIMRHPKDSR